MDVKVYQKEEVLQPDGSSKWIYMPNIIDVMPVVEVRDGAEVITGCTWLETGSQKLTEQECAIACIKQRGLDPCDLNDGIQWSECLIGEQPALIIMEQLVEAVEAVTSTVTVEFTTEQTTAGEKLAFTLQGVV